MLEPIVRLISAVAWPVTTLLVAWLLRREIRAAFGRIERAKLPGGAELSFGKSKADHAPEREKSQPEKVIIGEGLWMKVGNVYWLGHDIMWTIDVVLRGAKRETISHGLKQSLHHLNELELGDTIYGERLRRLHERAARSLESDWSAPLREDLALELRQLSDELGAIAAMQQPAFAAGPTYDTRGTSPT